MTEFPGRSGPPPTDWHQRVPSRAPLGLFPPGPARPTYREPNPVRGSAVAAGCACAAAWLLAFGLLGRDLRGYAWWTILASLVAWLVAVLLIRHGDRGVATGVGIATTGAVSIASTAVAVRWAETATWPLW